MSVTHTVNGKEHENYHYCLRRKQYSDKNLEYLPIGHYKHSSINCIGCKTSINKHNACDWKYDEYIDEDVDCCGYTSNNSLRNDLNYFKQLLKTNNLYKNKDIPIEYLINDTETRLKLLAGFIDTDGTIKNNNDGTPPSIEISQCNKTHGHLVDKLEFLCKSLGFKTRISIRNSIRDTGYESEIKILSIFGNNLHTIPTKLERKKIFEYKRKNNTYYSISVEEIDDGNYVGWHIDKNERFLLGDFTVTHNTRNNAGNDAASPRYIFTKMELLTPLLFREEDDVLLEYVVDDGDVLEPKFYIPILPTILINGCTAIGTGWSSNIPCYNPKDIINCVKIWLENEGDVFIEDPDNDGSTLSLLPSIMPWYRGFKGVIEEKDNKYITYGILTKETVRANRKVSITELPIGMWTDNFKEYCEDLLVEKKIKALHNNSTPYKVDFTITECEDGMSCNLTNMKMFTYLNITNMVLFNEKDQLRKYSIDEIINEFCIVRYDFYKKRKAYLINQIEKELRHLGNKERFIQEVVDKKLNIMNVDEEVLVQELEKRKYDKEGGNEDDENGGGYGYLLRMPVKVLTSNQIKKLKNDIESHLKRLKEIKRTSEKMMWLNDINDFEKEYDKWLVTMDNIYDNMKKKKSSKK
jgi:hypothetical protein